MVCGHNSGLLPYLLSSRAAGLQSPFALGEMFRGGGVIFSFPDGALGESIRN